MIARRLSGMCAVALAAVVGCQQGPPKGMSMDEMMKPPPRPAELDRLGSLVGSWEGSGECKMAGQDKSITNKGSNTVTWDCDKRVLVERWEGEMGEGNKMHGIGVWTWDSEDKKYKIYWFDNFGGTGEGEATYNDATRTWTMNSESEGPMGKTVGKGTIKMVDNNTMDYTWEEWNGWKTQKMMEMKGTSRRKAAVGG